MPCSSTPTVLATDHGIQIGHVCNGRTTERNAGFAVNVLQVTEGSVNILEQALYCMGASSRMMRWAHPLHLLVLKLPQKSRGPLGAVQQRR